MADWTKCNDETCAAIDHLILRSLEAKLDFQLDRAYHELEYVHDELKTLCMAHALPKAYREAYARLRDIAAPPLRALHEASRKQSREWLGFDHVDLGMPSPAWIARARQVLEQINALDLELGTCLRETRQVLLKAQPNAIFDWTMPLGLQVTFTLDHGPNRSIYDHIDQFYVGDSKYRFQVGCEYNPDADNGEVDNWSEFTDPDHPLYAGTCRMTYLGHCMLHHLDLPWQLLPCIDEIEATLRFHDYQTVWPVAKREVRARRAIED